MTRPTRDELLMEHAKLAALRGTCQRAQVGVVVARDGRILVTGYNGAPAGLSHCTHQPDDLLPDGCKRAVHAECNAIAYAARYGIPLLGGTLYTTHMSCLPCAQLIINAGIVRLVADNPYRDPAGMDLLFAAGLQVNGNKREQGL